MKTATAVADLKQEPGPVVLAAGFFDGLHRGHRAVIQAARECAARRGGRAWVMTFDRHPLQVLAPESAPALLTSTRHKLVLLERLGVDGCLILPFTRERANLSARRFVEDLFADAPGIGDLFVGRDWRFGKNAQGDTKLLRELALLRDVDVSVVPAVLQGGEPVSSTRLRADIASGQLDEAAALLGRPFSVLGTVARGDRIGRRLGFPTANLKVANEVLPPPGVYAAHAWVGNRLLDAAMDLGVRPTFAHRAVGGPRLELHLLDFDENLYGSEIEVFFVAHLRSEQAFASDTELRRAIARDVSAAREMLLTRNVKESLYTLCSGVL